MQLSVVFVWGLHLPVVKGFDWLDFIRHDLGGMLEHSLTVHTSESLSQLDTGVLCQVRAVLKIGKGCGQCFSSERPCNPVQIDY